MPGQTELIISAISVLFFSSSDPCKTREAGSTRRSQDDDDVDEEEGEPRGGQSDAEGERQGQRQEEDLDAGEQGRTSTENV